MKELVTHASRLVDFALKIRFISKKDFKVLKVPKFPTKSEIILENLR